MKYFILASAILAVGLASTYMDTTPSEYEEFEVFQQGYSKVYSTLSEQSKRQAIFVQNLRKINQHNANSKATWTMGVNEFTDLTDEEFKENHLGYISTAQNAGLPMAAKKTIDISSLPKSVDWREKGSVTAPKNQGGCGSCWAFATTEQIESYVHINNGTLLDLSPQHLTSCSPNAMRCGGDGGCKGSIIQSAFVYAQMFGLAYEKDYPYVSGSTHQTGKCTFDPHQTPAAASLRGYETLPKNDMASVMNHLANVGPLGVAVAASGFGSYKSGVFDGCNFDKSIDINHAVQLVGYGTDDKLGDYWIVRNSWGSRFGENGYIRIKRQSTTKCGTNQTPLHGIACVNDGEDTQEVCGTCGILLDTVYPIGATVLNM